MIDIAKFTEEVRDNRETALGYIGTAGIATYRDALRIACDETVWQIAEEKSAPARTEQNLRDELFTASRAAQLDGATEAQIDLIVSLCADKGDFARMGYARLTKRQASNLIDELKR